MEESSPDEEYGDYYWYEGLRVNIFTFEWMEHTTSQWTLLPEQDVDLILKMKIAIGSEDFKSWKFNKSGEYTVKAGCWLASQNHKSESRVVAEMLLSINSLKEQV